uniref:Ornithine decarboxylase n=1 Tax=viral metagenome TaxID=1070528 RepID=A0A6C0DGQ5_9ZZZZ
MKSNPDPVILKWIRELETVRLDCASPGEMRVGLKAGFNPSEFLYANTMKAKADLQDAIMIGASVTTTDSVEGVEQIAETYKDIGFSNSMKVIIRLAVDDSQSRSPFSLKYGATDGDWWPILKALDQHKIPFAGLSFHVGSASANPEAFTKAIRLCREFQQEMKRQVPIVDIGGGFLPDAKSFASTAASIRHEIERWDQEESFSPSLWIAEPGRFFSAPTQTLSVPIVFKKSSHDRVRYVLDESVYGQFSSIIFDHAQPPWTVYRNGDRITEQTAKKAFFFGRTCDSLDLIAIQDKAPEYEVGDEFVFPWMGAYTSASATTFNGFARPKKIYLEGEEVTSTFDAEVPDPSVTYPIETKSSVSLSLQPSLSYRLS